MDFLTLLHLGYWRVWIAAGFLCRLAYLRLWGISLPVPIDVWNFQIIIQGLVPFDLASLFPYDIQTRYPPKAVIGFRAMSLSTFFVSASSLHGELYFWPSRLPSFCRRTDRDLFAMKLDAKAIRYLTSEDFRVLQGVLISPSIPLYLKSIALAFDRSES